ncbi:MAG: formate hydrogenlyase transcriptional activator [Blastocatellia bacterium]|jgi:PAS domain S-box-containing protein|nr:formate hydrogenlyase transcriptional activator [Blastocatellia bacterium]
MATELRKSGISVVGDMSWGTHFCHFYETKEDLLDILTPYFKAGLENNEFCMWVVSDPVREEDVREALRLALPEAQQHLEAGRLEIVSQSHFLQSSRKENPPSDQLEIVPHTELYLKDGELDLESVVSYLSEKLADARRNGYEGMRANANEAWLTKDQWKEFSRYERKLNEIIANQRMIVLCSYPLTDSGAAEIFDVVHTHQFALVRRRGNWEVVESPELKQAKAEIQRLNEELEQRVLDRTRQLANAVERLNHQIAERKQAEAELSSAHRRLSYHVENTPLAVIEWDKELFIKRWSKRAEEIFGWKASEALGINMYDPHLPLVYEEDIQAVAKLAEQLIKGTVDRNLSLNRNYTKDGNVIYCEWYNSVLRDEHGNVITILSLVHDVTERKLSEDALRRSEDRLRLVIDTIPTMAWSLRADGVVDFANQRWLDYTGLALEEAIQEPTGAIHPEDLPGVMEKWLATMAAGEPSEDEMRLRRADGEYRWFLVRTAPLRDDQEKLVKWYGVAIDIEDRKHTEASLQDALNEINKLKDQLYKENIVLREEVINASMFEEIVGTSSALQAVLVLVTKVAPTDSTVLITGETGTGKELIARAIHKRSNRSERVFVTVHCAAIPPSLVASELFGHEKGAFTGAVQQRLGRFELAEGGTIFLDEIGELPADTQIALLRVLQEHEFERVGGTKSIRVDVRVIAATNRNLHAAIDAGTFRSDLFYRLNVFPIEMPALRERREDIPLLVEYFIHRYAGKMGKRIRRIDKKTMDALASSDWPGNIRELQNVIERSVILNETETFTIDKNWLTRQAQRTPREKALSDNLATHEKDMIEAALAESRGQVSGPAGAAAKLGIPPSTLDSRIKALKINKHAFKVLSQ